MRTFISHNKNLYKITQKNNIEALRNLRGVTLQELGNRINKSSVTIKKLQDGQIPLTEEYITKIVDILNCTREQLLAIEPIPTKEVTIQYNSKYIKYSMEIIDHVYDSSDIPESKRIEVLDEIYQVVYNAFENNLSKQQLQQQKLILSKLLEIIDR